MEQAYRTASGTQVLRRRPAARPHPTPRARASSMPKSRVARKRRRAADAVGLLAVAFILFLAFAVSQPAKLQAIRARLPFLAPQSTPRGEWTQGTVPYLYQKDPAWNGEPYAGATVGESGCGPTALTMAYVALTGNTDYDPPAMAAFSEANGYVTSGLTAWTLMTSGAQQLGLVSYDLSANEASLASALDAGEIVIASMLPGDFTTTGHFIVIAARHADGTLEVRDPNSVQRSAQRWDANRVLSQCAALWALSA